MYVFNITETQELVGVSVDKGEERFDAFLCIGSFAESCC